MIVGASGGKICGFAVTRSTWPRARHAALALGHETEPPHILVPRFAAHDPPADREPALMCCGAHVSSTGSGCGFGGGRTTAVAEQLTKKDTRFELIDIPERIRAANYHHRRCQGKAIRIHSG